MSASDYAMALHLQRQFEQESRPKVSDHDEQMARLLQEQFNHESNTERPTNNLVYKENKNVDSKKSLVDPSWELVDPTPNIHNLFMVFNERFFWNKLLTVCVSWSKRMTSCAGVCSYQGRGGMCSITLSEPLLKLRPRKDLVETLLHEMIHAFLFVTHNNKDRDGHGPEFHKHMYRINDDAGTNISVYHDFHDEVKLYQQHWWRCNGPCQNNKPYFGMVRRAQNRAPGPNDRWWGEHARNCGGSFVKVKEPEKATKTKKSNKENTKPAKPANPKNDIRNFLPPIKSPILINSTPTGAINKTIQPIKKVTPKAPATNNPTFKKPGSNIHGFSTSTPTRPTSSNPTFNNNANIKNIHGFHDVDKIRNKNVGGRTTMNAGTLVVTKPPSTITKPSQEKEPCPSIDIPVFSGHGNVLSASKPSTSDYSTVRNHWVSKFETTSKKRESDNPLDKKTKRVKTDAPEMLTKCPICDKMIPVNHLNEHLDTCLNSDSDTVVPPISQVIELDNPLDKKPKRVKSDASEMLTKCPICDKMIPVNHLNEHLDTCLNSDSDTVVPPISQVIELDNPLDKKPKRVKTDAPEKVPPINQVISIDLDSGDDIEDSLTECDICNERFNSKIITEHMQKCLQNVSQQLKDDSLHYKECGVCSSKVNNKLYDQHVAACLLQMYDHMESKARPADTTKCLVCKREIPKDNLNAHLEECMSDTIFSDDGEKEAFCKDNSLMEEYERSSDCEAVFAVDYEGGKLKDNSVTETCEIVEQVQCPICLQSVNEIDINEHLDQCL